MAILAERGLVCDLPLKIREVPAALHTVAEFPTLRFTVDHITKPDIKMGAMSPWAELIGGFTMHRDHVWCKRSGMAEEADWVSWTANDLKRFVDRAIEVFGPDRSIFGSNRPICLLAGDYPRIKNALEQCIATLSDEKRAEVMGGSAIAAHGLQAPPARGKAAPGRRIMVGAVPRGLIRHPMSCDRLWRKRTRQPLPEPSRGGRRCDARVGGTSNGSQERSHGRLGRA